MIRVAFTLVLMAVVVLFCLPLNFESVRNDLDGTEL